jgi:outer membrane lipopolysaccharide assembly protein LptE/RlpB
MKSLAIIAVLSLTGCGTHMRVGSPQFQRAPELICIVIVDPDERNEEIAKAAINACREAIEEEEKEKKL